MKPTKIAIIDLGVGGFIAAKKANSSAEITIIDEKEYGMYPACKLPFAMEGL
jgi:NADPH-dependent 2,4-dienoyl-CoA reductase/sulfur reductase-like enzyme